MILTGKAEVDFIKWASYNYGEDSGDLAMMREVYRNALIIEFFDEYGIHINIFYKYTWRIEIIDFRGNLLSDLDFADFETRQEATIQAIKQANDIYNERN